MRPKATLLLIALLFSTLSHSQVMTYKPFATDYNISIFDVYKLDMNDDKFSDFVVLYGDRDPNKTAPVRCLINNKEEKYFDFSDQCFLGAKAHHARNLTVANLNNNPALGQILIADHGPDKAPFAGGLSLVLQKKKTGSLFFENQTKEFLPTLKKQFTYSIANGDVNGDDFEDLYFAIYTNRAPFFRMMINQQNGSLKEDNSLLPINDSAFLKCFMSAQLVDLDLDGVKELVLGGCNMKEPQFHSKNDLILKKNSSGKFQNVVGALPLRHKQNSWGTNAFNFVDLNKDGLLDIVATIHDFGSERGEIKIYINQKKLKFREIKDAIKLDGIAPMSFYIQRVVTTDLNHDGYHDLFFTLRDNSRRSGKLDNCVFVMLNDKKEKFVDVSSQLPISKHCYAAVETIENPNIPLLEMIFFDYDGTISTIKSPDFVIPKVLLKKK